MAVGVPTIAGIWAARNLLQVGESTQCQASAAITDSYAARLYCADELAEQQTPEALRQAIKLVSSIPADDPLRMSGDRRLERWSNDLLRVAEASFQSGKLDEAITAARTIPITSKVYGQAQDRIKFWQETWETGETAYQEATEAIENKEWSNAVGIARKLLALDSNYWQIIKHQELMDELQAAQEQEKAQAKAAKVPKPDKTLTKWEQNFEAEAIARLQKAEKLASSGKVEDLQAAISEARQIYFGTSVYDQAQRRIDVWDQQVVSQEDRNYLDRAIRLANRGDVASLQAGIDAAYRVSAHGKLYQEARSRIDQWSDQIYRLQYATPDLPPPTLTSGDRLSAPLQPQPVVSPLPPSTSEL